MVRLMSLPLRMLSFSIAALVATAAAAAPINTATPTQDCLSAAAFQRTLEHAQCSALPIQLRDNCILKAEQNYAIAVASCAGAGAKRTITLKQNVEAPFARRLRY